ncbi:MAG: hypothetical protein ACR2IK_00175 [Chloroflexota bacterium]
MRQSQRGQQSVAIRIGLRTLGVVLVVTGLALSAAIVVELFAPGNATGLDGSIGALIIFVAMIVGGIAIARTTFSRHSKHDRLEAQVLALAETVGGELTIDVTAAHCGLSVTESKDALDRLVAESGAQCTITPDGVLVYSFPGLVQPRAERRSGPSAT